MDEDDTKVVDKELVKELDEGLELIDVVVVMVIEEIMNLTVAMQRVLDKAFDMGINSEVDKEMTKDVFTDLICFTLITYFFTFYEGCQGFQYSQIVETFANDDFFKFKQSKQKI